MNHLLGFFSQPGDQVVPVLALLQATESHLGAWNVFLGVLEVVELSRVSLYPFRLCTFKTYQGILVPCDAGLLVGIGVGEAFNGAGLSAKEAVKVRADLVALGLDDRVALSASGLEEVCTLLGVT